MAWAAARRGLVAGWCDLVRGQASLAVWRRHRPTCDPAACLLSMVFEFHHLKLKCRWFFGRVFSFPLVEEFV